MTDIRVLQFITPSGFYGAERWILALVNNMSASRVSYDLAVTRESDRQDLSVADYFPKDAGIVHYLPMTGRFDLRVVRRLVHIIRERRINVIHTHGYKSDILGLLAAWWAGIACVSTPHGFSNQVSFKLRAFIRVGILALRFFDRVVPLSDELMDDMKRFNIPEGKLMFVRNGVDLREIDAKMSKKANEPMTARSSGQTFKLGFVGQMIPRKGIPDLLTIFDDLHRTHGNTALQLLGDGRQRLELEHMATQLDSHGAIEFLGFRHDRLDYMSDFDLFVMTSSLEGIPRCMMEAMAMGIPVVAYDIPGVDKLIDHDRTGLLVPHGDRTALVEACRSLIDDPDLAARLATAARHKIESEYSAEIMASRYEHLFAELVDNQLSSRASVQRSR